ncbi:MAG: hypothetical protein Q8N23_34345 [Archangium sp.]|nr:hypothetical protein [Archangium sp.]MDP3157802.1 hypothetical protein [Archangium sp.]MDP3576369.1 hypothetical protein [Archangium sp.]
MKTPLALLLLLAACAHQPPKEPCNDTTTCRDRMLEREQAFAHAVANEPRYFRLQVEPVSENVVVERARQIIYVLDPVLVALDLQTGKERWRAKDVSGDAIWRAGRFLAITSQQHTLPPKVTFLDPGVVDRPVECTVTIPLPQTADRAALHVFDRAGQPYLYWRSGWSYSGGTRPGPAELERQRDSTACGVVKIDAQSCAQAEQPLADFVWNPTGSRVQSTQELCANLSPMGDLPAAAASAAKYAPNTLSVTSQREHVDRCNDLERLTLVSRDEAGAVVWSRPLESRQLPLCKPP